MSVRRLLSFLPLAVLVLLVAVGAFMLLGQRDTEKFEGASDRPMPAFELARLDGQGTLTSEDMAGRPYVVNIFASWCAPCRVEHPVLMQLEAQGVEILGVAYKNAPDEARAFLARMGNPFENVVLDPEGAFGLELGFVKVPETFVISADGRIVAVYRGLLTEEAVAQIILPALQAP